MGDERFFLKAQRSEVTEAVIYHKLSKSIKNRANKIVLAEIAKDEERHAAFWKEHTRKDVKPNMFFVWYYFILSRVFGLTFGLKLMEHGERNAQAKYGKLTGIKEIKAIEKDEVMHEKALIKLIKEEKLDYVSSIVLGLNDALVELTGALAGLTLALQDSELIAMAGLITGIAASLSMGASEYLSSKSEKHSIKNPLKASIYTGIAYIITVLLLVMPYFIFSNPFVSLVVTLIIVIAIIALFTFYVSVVEEKSFRKQFLEMALLSLTIAAISFGVGYVLKAFLGVDA